MGSLFWYFFSFSMSNFNGKNQFDLKNQGNSDQIFKKKKNQEKYPDE